MEIIEVKDINGKRPSIYEVWFLWRLIYASESEAECENYIDKRGFLYYNLLLW